MRETERCISRNLSSRNFIFGCTNRRNYCLPVKHWRGRQKSQCNKAKAKENDARLSHNHKNVHPLFMVLIPVYPCEMRTIIKESFGVAKRKKKWKTFCCSPFIHCFIRTLWVHWKWEYHHDWYISVVYMVFSFCFRLNRTFNCGGEEKWSKLKEKIIRFLLRIQLQFYFSGFSLKVETSMILSHRIDHKKAIVSIHSTCSTQ